MIIEILQSTPKFIENYIKVCPIFYQKSSYHIVYNWILNGEQSTAIFFIVFYIIPFSILAFNSFNKLLRFSFLPRVENRFSIFDLYSSQIQSGYYYLHFFALFIGLLFPLLVPCLIAFLIGLFMTTWIYLIWRDRRFMKKYRQRKREEEIRKRDKDARTR